MPPNLIKESLRISVSIKVISFNRIKINFIQTISQETNFSVITNPSKGRVFTFSHFHGFTHHRSISFLLFERRKKNTRILILITKCLKNIGRKFIAYIYKKKRAPSKPPYNRKKKLNVSLRKIFWS